MGEYTTVAEQRVPAGLFDAHECGKVPHVVRLGLYVEYDGIVPAKYTGSSKFFCGKIIVTSVKTFTSATMDALFSGR